MKVRLQLEEYILPIVPAVSNDFCSNAKSIQVNENENIIHKYKDNLNYAKGEQPNYICSIPNPNNGRRNVWYKFTALSEITAIVLNQDNDKPISYGATIYKGDCKDLTFVRCGTYFDNLQEGSTYYLQIQDLETEGDSKYEFYLLNIQQPKNQFCSSAVNIPVSTTTQPDSLIRGSNSWVINNNYYKCDGKSELWYKFTATASKHRISFQSDIFDKNKKPLYTIGVYRNPCNGTDGFVRCIENPEANNNNLILANLQMGAAYYLRVARLYEFGEYPQAFFKLGISQIDTAFEAFDCERALDVPVNDSTVASKFLTINTKNSPIIQQDSYIAKGTIWLKFKATAKRHKLVFAHKKTDLNYNISFSYTAQHDDCTTQSPNFLWYQTIDSIFEGLTIGKNYYIQITAKKQLTKFSSDIPLLIDIDMIFDAAIITMPNRPENDEVATAKVLTVGSNGVCSETVTHTTLNALSKNSSCTYAFPNIWYEFIAKKGFHIIDIQDLATPSGENRFEYELLNNMQERIVCSQNQAYQNKPILLNQGSTYLVRVFNRNPDARDARFSICVRQALPFDEVLGAKAAITDSDGNCNNPFSLNTEQATLSLSPTVAFQGCSLATPPRDVWFSTKVKKSKLTLTFVKKPSGALPIINVYRKFGNDYFLVKNLCTEDTLKNLTTGETLYFRLWSNNNALGTYEICLNAHGIIATQDIVTSDFRIFPNPANDFLTIESDNLSLENAQISIVDVLGKRVYQYSFSENKNTQYIDIQQLTSGIYFLQIRKKGEQWTRKFIKQ